MAGKHSSRTVSRHRQRDTDVPAPPSPQLEQSLAQAKLLRSPRARAIWGRLNERQQRYVFDPSIHPKVARRYPLTSGDVAALTGLSERRVRYWADQGLIPHTRSEGGRRRFDTVGLLLAFGLAHSRQNDVHFYREIAQQPAEAVSEKIDVLANILATRVEQAEPAERDALATSAALLARVLGLAEGLPDFLPLRPDAPATAVEPRAEAQVTSEKRHVIRDGDSWVVKKGGGGRPSSRHATQHEAEKRAAEILSNLGGGERVTHGRDGRIRSTDTIAPARDSHPPRRRD